MKIHSVRLGLAMNSSSSHSLIFLKPGERPADSTNGSEFGWDRFTASDAATKRCYLAQLIKHAMERTSSSEVAQLVAAEWAGVPVGRRDEIADGYIDHQSLITLPRDWSGLAVDRGFVEDFRRFLDRPDVAVLGGNDNDDESHELLGDHAAILLELPVEDHGDWRCREDPLGFWVLFNRDTGCKMRMTFNDVSARPVKASLPELVDVKITDFCNFGCKFCYQGSTIQGKHADAQFLSSLASVLGSAKVFEVAIGGGEPTTHPGFAAFLRTLRGVGCIPTFTTRDTSWLHSSKTIRRFFSDEAAGGVAFSVGSAEDVKNIYAALHAEIGAVHNHRITFQHVMGTSHEYPSIVQAAAALEIDVTLLGFKHAGRGADYYASRHRCSLVANYKDWVAQVQRVLGAHGRIRIDTALAAESQEELRAAGVDKAFYEVVEGAFSMYIDAVEMTVAPSSYGDPARVRKVQMNDFYERDGSGGLTALFKSLQVPATTP